MKNSFLYIILLGVALVQMSCHKSNSQSSTPINPQLEPLVGQWRWVEQIESGGMVNLPPDTVTAASLGITEYLSFNNNLTWSLQEEGSIVAIGTYKIDSITSLEGPIPMLDLLVSGRDSLVTHSVSGDTLYMFKPLNLIGPSIEYIYVKRT